MIKALILSLSFLFLMGCQPGDTRPQQHVALDPEAAEINMRLGLNYMQRGDYAIALEKLEKSLKQNPNLASAHETIALLYQRLGVLDKAEKHFKEAIRRKVSYSEAHNNYGVFLCQQGRYDASEKHFLLAITNPLYKSAAQAIENAGLCVSRIPDLIRAEDYFHKALQINPKMAKSLLNLADINYQKQDYVQAKAYIKRHQTVSLWSPQALLVAIKIEKKLGEEDEVASHIMLLKGKFPDSEQAQEVRKGAY